MIVAFFESIKYSGHLFPLAFLRAFIGLFYIQKAYTKYTEGFLQNPTLAEFVSEGLAFSTAPTWYQDFLGSIVIPNWSFFAYFVIVSELLIGISFVLGYLVKPLSLLGIFLCLNMMALLSADQVNLFQILLALHITFWWLGAGRCLGFDYYFYKRMRGLWW